MSDTCPICHAPVTARRPENPSFPFCSARCRTVDLGRWIDGAYAIPVRDETPSDDDLSPRGAGS